MSKSSKTVAVLIGSLRERSINRYLFNAILELAPFGLTFVEAPISELPHYNADLEEEGVPAPVTIFRDHIRASDGVLVITPEFNYSIPGVLKNAIDWLWAPSTTGAAYGKPGAMLGASIGRSGTMRAQLHLRDIFLTLNIIGLNKPEVYITFAGDKFDADGNLIDEDTRSQVEAFLEAFKQWIERVGSG